MKQNVWIEVINPRLLDVDQKTWIEYEDREPCKHISSTLTELGRG